MFAAPKSVVRPVALAAAAAAAAAGFVAVRPAEARVPVAPPAAASDSKLFPKVKPATPNDLDFRPADLTVVTDQESGGRYWVFTYAVANKTGKTQRFSPRFELLMGDGTVLAAGKDVPVEVSRRLQRAVTAAQSLDQFQIMGDILDGEANAREGFVVWPAKGDAKEVTLFVSGMSAAFDRVTDKATGKDGIVRRSWSRHYALPGTADPRRGTPAAFDPIKDEWLMR